MAHPKPTIVLVTGISHPSSAYKALVSHLEEGGYPVLVTNLPSLNPEDPSGCSCCSDAASVREQLLPAIEESKDVIMLCHSYGGIPAGGAACGLSQSARAKQGQKGGVVGLIYISAVIVPEGMSLVNYLGGLYPPYILCNEPSEGLFVITTAKELLFGDVPSPLDVEIESSLLPHAMLAFESPAPPAAWQEPEYSGKIAFLRCTQDAAISASVQDSLIDRSQVKWMVKDLEASHSPFASKPAEVVKAVEEFAQAFERVKA